MENKKIFDIIPPKTKKITTEDFRKEKYEEEEEIIEKTEEKKTFFSPFLKISVLVVVIVILIAGIIHFRWSKIEIEIWPEIKNLNFETKVIIDTKADKFDILNMVIPGKIFEEEKVFSQKFNSTGKAIKEEKAKGVIRVYNNYHLPQTLIATTRFQPAVEKVLYFRTVKTITIPAKSYLDVEVVADRPGEDYNIEPSTFSIPGLAGTPQYYSIYGKSSSPMVGGAKGETKVVSKEDLERAKNILIKKIENEAKNYLKEKISEDYILLDKAIDFEIIEATSSVSENVSADSFDFNLKAKIKTISFKKSDLESFSSDLFNLKFPQTNKMVKKEIKNDYSFNSFNLETGNIVLNLKILVKTSQDINISDLKEKISGKKIKEVKFLLGEISEINKYKIKVFPFWLNRIPLNSDKTIVKLMID